MSLRAEKLHLRLDGGASLILHKAGPASGLDPGEAMLLEEAPGGATLCSFLHVLAHAMRDESGGATTAIVGAEDFDRLTSHLRGAENTLH